MSKKSSKKTVLIILGLLFALAGGYFLGSSGGGPSGAGVVEKGAAKEKIQYTCGMHPFVIQDEPGICPICAMDLTPLKPGTGGQGGTGERKVKMWKSPMDPTYVSQEPGKDPMGHDLVPVYEDGSGGSAISIDPVTAQNMGIRTVQAALGDLSREIRTVGLVDYRESARYAVNSKIAGWIERLYVNETGQVVEKGKPLLDIYSPELVAAQEEYLLALRNRSELAKSSFSDIAEGGDRLLEAARKRLKYWDISERQIAELEKTGKVRKTMTLYSPYYGIVVEKTAFEGMSIMPGMELMQIADISRVWVLADIYEYELPWVAVGQKALVEIPYAVDRTLEGTVTYLYPYVDPKTRTIKARIELPNPGFQLKPDMYANVRLKSRSVEDVLTIPVDAVLNSGTGQTVFVALGEGKFEPRPVKTGLQDGEGRVQVLSGLGEGEQVVTSAQFMLDSESKLREAIQKMMQPQPMEAPGGDDLEGLFGGDSGGQGSKEDLEDLFE